MLLDLSTIVVWSNFPLPSPSKPVSTLRRLTQNHRGDRGPYIYLVRGLADFILTTPYLKPLKIFMQKLLSLNHLLLSYDMLSLIPPRVTSEEMEVREGVFSLGIASADEPIAPHKLPSLA